MRVLTWNILSSEWEPKMEDFVKRKPLIKKMLIRRVYDVILLQEVDKRSYRFIRKELSKIYWISKMAVIEWSDDPEIETGNVILIRKKWKGNARVKEIGVDLNDGGILMITLKRYVIINVHLTLKSMEQRLKDIKYLNLWIKTKFPKHDVILGGDFNNNLMKTKRIHKYLISQGYDNAVSTANKSTYLPYKAAIDFVYTKGVKKTNGKIMDTDNKKKISLKELGSDHYPVLASLTV